MKQTIQAALYTAIAAAERLTAHNPPLSEITNFLLLQHPSALGTAIHATPIIPALRHAVPNCRIAVVASGFALEVFRNNPGVDHLIETPSPLHNLKASLRSLRTQNPFTGTPHATLTTTGNERTRIAAQAILSGATLRIGHTVAPQLYSIPLTFDYSLSQIANNLRILTALGHAPQHFEPQIFFTPADLAEARQILTSASVPPGQPIAIFITQTSPTQRKSWPKERFQAAATFLAQRYNAHILFVGSASEADAIDDLRAGLVFPTTNVAGKTRLPLLAALMSLATIGLTLDTGPMHIGRAVGLPMVIIAPAWSPPIEWLPVADPRFRILKNATLPSAPPDYIIDEVPLEEVTAALTDLLQHSTGSPATRHTAAQK